MQETNEQLTIKAKAKDKAALWELYARNQRFIRLMCMKYAGERMTEDDVMQESYIALVKAVEAYDEAQGYSFLTYFGNALKWHFNNLVQSDRNKDDLLILDRPLNDETTDTLADTIADEAADFENDLTDRLAKSEVFEIARETLDQSTAPYYEIIERHYRDGETFTDIAEDMGEARHIIVGRANRALCILQNNLKIKEFESDYISASLQRGSYSAWRNTGESSTEWATFKILDRKDSEA